MDEFKLEHWEVPVGVEVSQFSEAALDTNSWWWNGRETQMLLRAVPCSASEEWVFFRPQDGSNINFVACECEGGWPVRPVAFPDGFLRAQTEVFPPLSRSEGLGRVFFFRGACAVVNENQCGWLERKLVPFHLPFPHFETPSRTIFGWLMQQWNNSDSEVHFTFNWASWDDEARSQFAASLVPEWGEVRRLMRVVALLDVEMTDDVAWNLGNARFPSSVDNVGSHRVLPFSYTQLATRLQSWSEVFKRYFLPFSPLPGSAPLVLHNYFEQSAQTLNVRGEDASWHQKAEARLRLRQWLDRHAPQEIERLLPG